MANSLKADRQATFHQALHGYADGHRQLASSTRLTARDQRTVLALSDVSGPGIRLDDEGYLTGYPLFDSGFFALARTWAAPEMPRPGCVWTHTIFIDFTDLGILESLTLLLNLFRRPQDVSAALEYGKSITLALHEGASRPPPSSIAWTRRVVSALYGKPQNRIFVTRPNAGADDIIVSLWSQQWPRLRRNFRFCTFTTSDRSVDGAIFDLQVVPTMDRSVRARFFEAIDAEAVTLPISEWVDETLEDLFNPDGQGLRTFLRQAGADVGTGRSAFLPLCSLHRAIIDFQRNVRPIDDAIAILEDQFEAIRAPTTRALVMKAALERLEDLDQQSFRFLWDHLDSIDADTLASNAVHLGCSAWRRDPRMLVRLVDQKGPLLEVVERTVSELSLPKLVQGLEHAPSLTHVALTRRPDLLAYADFWAKFGAADEGYATAKKAGVEREAISAIMRAGRSDLAERSIREFGSAIALGVLSNEPNHTDATSRVWMQACSGDAAGVAYFLATQKKMPLWLLDLMIRTLPPDAIPNDYGPDPWVIGYQNAAGNADQGRSIYLAAYLAAYLLSRALGNKSRSPGELAQLGFETTHTAAAGNYLGDDAWRLLDRRLPSSVFWFDWDRCQRLRAGVTNLFVDRDLSPVLFANLVKDIKLFWHLAREASQTRRGRDFLKRVRQALKDRELSVDRLEVVDSLI